MTDIRGPWGLPPPPLEELKRQHGFPEVQPIQGWFSMRLWGPDGTLKTAQDVPNLITTTGKNMLAGWFTGGAAGGFAINLAIGTGSTTPVVANTTLTTETGTRVSAGRAITANTAYYSGLFTANNPPGAEGIQEYGNFSLAAAGYIFAHSTAAVISKATADTLEVQYRFSFP